MRIAEKNDLPALCVLWQRATGCDAAFAKTALERFAAPGQILTEDCSLVCALPVTIGQRRGVYFYGLTAPAGGEAAFLQRAEEWVKQDGALFAVARPMDDAAWALFDRAGYEKAFSTKRVRRPIRPNLWAQADFDTVTVRSLEQLRAKYVPEAVRLPLASMVEVLTDLYGRGLTIVSTDDAYGLYFKEGETLRFVELFAGGDRAAERLWQAAREKVGGLQAELLLGAEQPLFLGEGSREDYGCIKFFARPFDVTESYMRLVLDVDKQGRV